MEWVDTCSKWRGEEKPGQLQTVGEMTVQIDSQQTSEFCWLWTSKFLEVLQTNRTNEYQIFSAPHALREPNRMQEGCYKIHSKEVHSFTRGEVLGFAQTRPLTHFKPIEFRLDISWISVARAVLSEHQPPYWAFLVLMLYHTRLHLLQIWTAEQNLLFFSFPEHLTTAFPKK